jgi:hypothetical protein
VSVYRIEEDRMQARVCAAVLDYPTSEAAARAFGVSPQFLCDVRKGRREVGDRLAAKLGFRRIVLYERNESVRQAAAATEAAQQEEVREGCTQKPK